MRSLKKQPKIFRNQSCINKQALLLSIAVFFFCFGKSQQVVSTSGSYHKNTLGSITYTLGEPVVSTFISDDFTLTQGFNQSKLKITLIWEMPDVQVNMKAYPNPTYGFITIEVPGNSNDKWDYLVYDQQGRQVGVGGFYSQNPVLDFYSLEPAVYFLKVYTEKKLVKTFKIIKE